MRLSYEKTDLFRQRFPRLSGLLFLLVCFSLVVLPGLLLWFMEGQLVRFFVSAIGGTGFLFLLTGLFGGRPRSCGALLLPIALLSPIPLLAALYGVKVDDQFLAIVLDAGWPSASVFLADHLLQVLLSWILITCLWLFAVRLLPEKLNTKLRYSLFLLGFSVMFITPMLLGSKSAYVQRVRSISFLAYPFNVPEVLKLTEERLSAIERYQESVSKVLVDGKRLRAESSDIETFVFVLGESQRFDRWGINGYHRDTTPKLDQRENLLSFQDLSAPSHTTSFSAPSLLTSADHHLQFKNSIGTENACPSLVRVMKEAGFYCSWFGPIPSKGTAVIDSFAHEAHQRPLTGFWDGDAVATLEAFLDQTDQKKNFIVFHMIGSHWKYEERYPENFHRYKPSSMSNRYNRLAVNKENFNNAYDNTVLYADHNLDRVIAALEKRGGKSALFFVSDHGEHLMDDDRELILHTIPSLITVQVPAFAWISPSHRTAHPEIWKALEGSLHSRLSGADAFHTFLEIAGVRCRQWKATRSFANKQYSETKRSVYLHQEGGMLLDFDNRANWPTTQGDWGYSWRN